MGVKDLCGNVSEWTRTTYRPYPYDSANDRGAISSDGEKVVRGGNVGRDLFNVRANDQLQPRLCLDFDPDDGCLEEEEDGSRPFGARENDGISITSVAGQPEYVGARETITPSLHSTSRTIPRSVMLSTAANDLISEGRARVKVIPAFGPWLGVTFPGDRRYVAEKLSELVEARDYPADISAAMRLAE